MRTETREGYQIVMVDVRYSFAWAGDPPLVRGEPVIAEGRNKGSHFTGIVTSLGTEYTGPLKMIERRVIEPPTSETNSVPKGEHIKDEPDVLVMIGSTFSADYASGMSIRQIASKYKVSFYRVRQSLLAANTKLRHRGSHW